MLFFEYAYNILLTNCYYYYFLVISCGNDVVELWFKDGKKLVDMFINRYTDSWSDDQYA